ncbi:uncharacterized protein V1518DRAFT_379748 [Limtongia smithiae]|uniref:uncharacterized protein n=1 Tax=Limtongia smithiae TaxID=1125753 RepID=UPI0034CEB57F
MSSISRLFAGLVVLLSFAALVKAHIWSDAPGCFKPCVENTKIISECRSDDLQCLCNDEYYQSSLYGCLFSQCTAKELPFAQNLANSNCVKFNVQSGENPHIAKRYDHEVFKRDGMSSSSSRFYPRSSSRVWGSSSRLSMSSGYGLSSSYYPYESGAGHEHAARSYTAAPSGASHMVKRMEEYGVNECGQSCFYAKLASAGCNPTDLACICSSAYFNAVTDCLVDSCYDQIPLAFKVRPALCS